MQVTTAIIIDDEPAAIQKLKIELNRVGVDLLGSVTNPLQSTEFIKEKNPDLVFLDVQMPQESGIEVLKDIVTAELECTVIMVTAFNDFMLDAFRNLAFDYLLKPVDTLELKKVVERFKVNRFNKVEKEKVEALINHLNRKIRIPSTYETHFFDPEQILFLKADGKYTILNLSNGKQLTTSINLGAVEELLPKGVFLRISKSIVINLQCLNKINRKNKTCILFNGNDEISLPFSKLYISKLEQSY